MTAGASATGGGATGAGDATAAADGQPTYASSCREVGAPESCSSTSSERGLHSMCSSGAGGSAGSSDDCATVACGRAVSCGWTVSGGSTGSDARLDSTSPSGAGASEGSGDGG